MSQAVNSQYRRHARIYHRRRESTDAHLTIVFAALAISHWIEDRTGWSIRKFVRTARRYRTIEIQVGTHTITAADPLPDDLRHALDHIHQHRGAHQSGRTRVSCRPGQPAQSRCPDMPPCARLDRPPYATRQR